LFRAEEYELILALLYACLYFMTDIGNGTWMTLEVNVDTWSFIMATSGDTTITIEFFFDLKISYTTGRQP